jgi:N-acetylglucosaminyl-diphospho-decaprenol L-rhamnosyltransferase
MSYKKVSVIVPAYIPDKEVYALFLKMWGALWASCNPYQVIVVENGSAEISEGLTLIRKPHPIGYARAANIGMALADGDMLVIMNVDVVVSPGWLEALLAQYEEYAVPGGILSPDDRGRSGIWEESWFGLVMLDRLTFETVGYFDQTLPFRFHDQDYAIRVKQKGFKVLRTGGVQVRHYESSTYNKMNLREQEQKERAEMIRRYGVEHFRDLRFPSLRECGW